MDDPRSFFTRERGITVETLDAFGITNEDDLIAIPYEGGLVKLRKQSPDGHRKIWWNKKGVRPPLFYCPPTGGKSIFLVEGESDTMRLWQEAGVPVFGLSGVDSWQTEFSRVFDPWDTVFVLLDNDGDYNVKAQVDAAWLRIRSDIGTKARRIKLPYGVKDVCDFFDNFGVEELKELAKSRASAESRYKVLNLNQTPPPMNWLVDGMLGMGDVTIMAGDPGLGKSWLAMDLAIGIAEENEGRKWLGHEIMQTGRVLMIDEENPLDIVLHRFKKLGLHPDDASNIRYVHRPGIWLNKDPDTLLQEALEFDPKLIVLDSLSRIHTEDENSAGAMAKLFKEAIHPLARETGAAVLLIHHSNKGDGNSFQRIRGSSDISASVDAGFDVRGTRRPGVFTIKNFKSRRRLGGDLIAVRLEDTPEGGVRLISSQYNSEDDMPF